EQSPGEIASLISHASDAGAAVDGARALRTGVELEPHGRIQPLLAPPRIAEAEHADRGGHSHAGVPPGTDVYAEAGERADVRRELGVGAELPLGIGAYGLLRACGGGDQEREHDSQMQEARHERQARRCGSAAQRYRSSICRDTAALRRLP